MNYFLDTHYVVFIQQNIQSSSNSMNSRCNISNFIELIGVFFHGLFLMCHYSGKIFELISLRDWFEPRCNKWSQHNRINRTDLYWKWIRSHCDILMWTWDKELRELQLRLRCWKLHECIALQPVKKSPVVRIHITKSEKN